MSLSYGFEETTGAGNAQGNELEIGVASATYSLDNGLTTIASWVDADGKGTQASKTKDSTIVSLSYAF